ncbi:4899_t:CDS:2, partial [Ambispora leptoticha]
MTKYKVNDHVKYYPKENNTNETATGVIKKTLDDGTYRIKPDDGGSE